MVESFFPSRIHVVLGSPWREAVIKHLEPSAPYRPWSAVSDVRPDDGVLVVFATQPRLVLRQVARVGPDGDVDAAIAELRCSWHLDPTITASAISVALDDGSLVEGDAAAELLDEIDGAGFGDDRDGRFGHSSAAAARALLESDGRCGSCRAEFDLRRAGAGDDIVVHTADAGSDWPVALCTSCAGAMHDGGYDSFVDFQFARHPRCPQCGAARTLSRRYGFPVSFDVPPWVHLAGCILSDERWTCGSCWHDW